MKQLIPMDEHGMFADYNDTALVDSRFVADAFEKGHREVLRSIDQILSDDSGYSAEFNRCNFAPITYTDVRGRKQRCYAMTRDGFTALVMGCAPFAVSRFVFRRGFSPAPLGVTHSSLCAAEKATRPKRQVFEGKSALNRQSPRPVKSASLYSENGLFRSRRCRTPTGGL